MCKEMCGNRDLLDDKVVTVLALLVDQMVENVVEQGCMFAEHRGDDTLKKDDIAFAMNQLFPELTRANNTQDVQTLIDQQVNLNHATANAATLADIYGTSISVGGQISTQNYKQKLMRVRKEQEQQMTMESLNKHVENIGPNYHSLHK